MKNTLLPVIICLLLSACSGGKRNEVIVFHAGSLAVPFSLIASEYETANPGVKILLEAAGSLVTARKITELQKPCDIMASADYQIIDQMLIPRYSDWNLGFATNEIVIAYTDRSNYSAEINEENWMEILLRKDVYYGRSDPDSDPCGYRTLLSLMLAEDYYEMKGLKESFENKDRSFIRPKEIDLTALLEVRSVDYIFQYRSVAVQHGLKYLRLPPEINLGDPGFAGNYRSVSIPVAGSKPGDSVVIRGDYIMYGVTLLNDAPNRDEAEKFMAFLAGPRGREIITATGQSPIVPPVISGKSDLPAKILESISK
jgi:molybdate/tungstate transport system substrate-binding protein